MKKYFYELMTDQRSGCFDKAVQWVLWVLSLAYGVIAELTHAMYLEHWLPVYKAPKPVISIGNITTGGVGKTPLVIWLVKALNQKGIKTVVVSRGYGQSKGLNDETRMFQEILPQTAIVTGRDRKRSIRKALSQGPVDAFIADDAFQHWPLARDLDILVIDAVNPFGNGYLIPRGILREKTEAIVRADILVLTKTDKVSNTKGLSLQLRAVNSRAPIVYSNHRPKQFRNIFTGEIQALGSFQNKKVVAFCAIGDPSFFESTVYEAGLDVVKNFTFIDHHHYLEGDVKQMLDMTRAENINILVTTHKDAVKMTPFRNLFRDLTVLSLEIDLEITQGQDEIIQRILSLCHT